LLENITPLIITYNEAPNIKRALDKLAWARRIVVIDSGSTDGTLEMLQSYSQVDVKPHAFMDFASQCNFGLSQISTSWALSLDADYELSDDFVREIRDLAPSESTSGYTARFVYRVYGRSLRGTIYPARTVLYRKNKASYKSKGHGHHVVIEGDVVQLGSIIYHDDRKPLSRWLLSQQRYQVENANYLLSGGGARLTIADKLRLSGWAAPLGVFLYVLFVKGCIFDGWAGWYYALQRATAEILLTLELIDRRLRGISER
jgi:glycosyltransferase involved in cell wall biosynthesis